MSDQSPDPAQERTDWAKERTRMAKERTFASQVRTALSFIGFGLGVAKLLPEIHPVWVQKLLGLGLIAGGVLTSLFAFKTISGVTSKLRSEGIKEPRWFVLSATAMLLVTAILALVVVGLDL